MSSLLGRAGSAGLERAVEVLDTLGSSMTSLNPSNRFVSGVTAKHNELSILSFEVANTIVKGSNILQSLSKRSIRTLKEVVLPSEGVQQLVSTDMDELLKIVATDKRLVMRVQKFCHLIGVFLLFFVKIIAHGLLESNAQGGAQDFFRRNCSFWKSV